MDSIHRGTSLQRRIVVGCLLMAGLSATTPNPGLTAASFVALALIVALVFRRDEPPIVLFALGYQWLAGATHALYANVLGVELWTLTRARGIEAAVYHTLGWVVVLALAIRVVLPPEGETNRPARDAMMLSVERLTMLYGAYFVVLNAVAVLRVPGSSQLVGAFGLAKWAILYVLWATVLRQRRGFLILAGTLSFELIVGWLGFFASFREPLIVAACALLTTTRIRATHVAGFAGVAALAIGLAVVWSAIKMDYRGRVNQGTRSQQVLVDVGEQVAIMDELIGELDAQRLVEGVELLVLRIAYVEYFGFTIDYVPSIAPHANGERSLAALKHIATPRLLFPNKTDIETDNSILEKYTGIPAPEGQGTSITIGVPAEAYVDGGPYFMYLIAAAFGLLYGFVYRLFLLRDRGIVGRGCATATLLVAVGIGPSLAKLLGGTLTGTLVMLVVWRLVGKRASEWAQRRDAVRPAPLREVGY